MISHKGHDNPSLSELLFHTLHVHRLELGAESSDVFGLQRLASAEELGQNCEKCRCVGYGVLILVLYEDDTSVIRDLGLLDSSQDIVQVELRSIDVVRGSRA